MNSRHDIPTHLVWSFKQSLFDKWLYIRSNQSDVTDPYNLARQLYPYRQHPVTIPLKQLVNATPSLYDVSESLDRSNNLENSAIFHLPKSRRTWQGQNLYSKNITRASLQDLKPDSFDTRTTCSNSYIRRNCLIQTKHLFTLALNYFEASDNRPQYVLKKSSHPSTAREDTSLLI